MARPKKQTIDYFPHYVGDGKTKLILQNEYGNDGYAFWYYLLELLCVTENQVFNYSNPASWRLLLAETHVTEDIATNLLQLLADLEAIDPELHKHKIIWSQNLVDNLEDVYKRRATGIPEKPVNVNTNPTKTNEQPINVNTNPTKTNTQPVNVNTNPTKTKKRGVSVNKSTQTRQDKTKQDKTKQDKDNVVEIVKIYEGNIGLLTPMIKEELIDIANEYSVEWFEEAVKVACANNVRRLSYVSRILENWVRDGYKVQSRAKGGGQRAGQREVKYREGN